MDSSAQTGLRVRHCYGEFYLFWSGLLMDWNDEKQEFKGLNLSEDQTAKYLYEMRSILFSILIANMIKLLEQFNLKLKGADTDINVHTLTGDTIDQELENTNDMELFLNYIEWMGFIVWKEIEMNWMGFVVWERNWDELNVY